MMDFDELDEVEAERRPFPGADFDGVTDIEVPEGSRPRVFLISDVHIDYSANASWLRGCFDQLRANSAGPPTFDCLVLPGDLTDSEEKFEEVMGVVAAAFDVVCFCFGNHEAWIRGNRKGTPAPESSFEKLDRIHRICQRLQVYTSPVRLLCHQNGQHLLLLPLWSWYHSSWDTEPDLPQALTSPVDPGKKVMDYRLCKWGELEQRPGFAFGGSRTSAVISEHFAARNEAWLEATLRLVERDGGQVLSFSHFCPRIELILEKRHTFDHHNARISGSAGLEQQIRRVRPVCHAFGHTHVPWDAVLDGVRYVNWGLGNLREREGQSRSVFDTGLLLLYDAGEWSPVQFTHWGYFHSQLEGRAPGSAGLAPWVSSALAQWFPDMVPELDARGLLRPNEDLAAYFPGGLETNSKAWFERHRTQNLRWRCPPGPVQPQHFPCESAGCHACPFDEEQRLKGSAWWAVSSPSDE